MNKHLALLKGINVGGHNKIKMAELREALTKAGLKNVITYIQSGNILFKSDKDSPALETSIHEVIRKQFGHDIPVLVLEEKELRKAIENAPFVPQDESEQSKYILSFLSRKPSSEELDTVKDISYEPDQWKIIDRTLYLYCPNGYGRTKFSAPMFERRLNVFMTARNWKSSHKFVELMKELPE